MLDIAGFHPLHFWLGGKQPTEPVGFDAASGTWNVYGHPEALTVLTDPRVFSSNAMLPRGELTDIADGLLPAMDGPEHAGLRRLVAKAFTPNRLRALESRILIVVDELLDRVVECRSFDLVARFARPLPVAVIAGILGVSASDRPLIDSWMDVLLDHDRGTRGDEQRAEDVMRAMRDYFAGLLRARRERPGDDFLTLLAHAEVPGGGVPEHRAANLAWLLLVAGHVTTMALIANTVLCLDRHPRQHAMVRADRALLPGAIEESLRVLSPTAVAARRTTASVLVGDATIGPEQIVLVWPGAANRDARVFARPGEFDVTRTPNPHLAFGGGPHVCLGAPLARLQGRLALTRLFDRFPELRVDPAAAPAFVPVLDVTGVRELSMLR